MDVPIQISFRGVEGTPDLKEMIHRKASDLEKYHSRINSCRVAVEKPHAHQRSGSPFRVRIDVTVPPGKELVVDRGQRNGDLHDDLKIVINDAFKAMRRQLKELVQRQQGRTKSSRDLRGLVVKVFPDDGYGFLKSLEEGREIFFHQNSVLDDDFDRLEVGTEVRYVEEAGDKGPQASTVQVVGKPGARRAQVEDPSVDVPQGWESAEVE